MHFRPLFGPSHRGAVDCAPIGLLGHESRPCARGLRGMVMSDIAEARGERFAVWRNGCSYLRCGPRRKNLLACSQTIFWSLVVQGACLIGNKSSPRSHSNPKSSLRSRTSRSGSWHPRLLWQCIALPGRGGNKTYRKVRYAAQYGDARPGGGKWCSTKARRQLRAARTRRLRSSARPSRFARRVARSFAAT